MNRIFKDILHYELYLLLVMDKCFSFENCKLLLKVNGKYV